MENKVTADYLDEEGCLHCGICGKRKQMKVSLMGFEHVVSCLCECEVKARQELDEKMQREEAQRLLYQRKSVGLRERRFWEWKFENDNGSNQKILIARQYVENWTDMKRKNVGLLLMGPVGTGKSFFAGCIANALLEQGERVMMTNFSRILNEMTSYQADKNQIIQNLVDYPLLIIDDLGIERNSEFALEQVYNVIDSRYCKMLPLIVTTNLGLNEMKSTDLDTAHQRIYSRILEMCVPIYCGGEDKRKEEPEKVTYHEPEGIIGFIKDMNRSKETVHDVIFFSGESEGISVEVAFQYVNEFHENVVGFCNNIYNAEGGTHLTGFKTTFTTVMNQYARELGVLKEKDANFTGADIRNGMTAIISIKHPDPRFEGQTKTKLDNPDAAKAVGKVTGEEIIRFFDRNIETLKTVLSSAEKAAKIRKTEERAKTNLLTKQKYSFDSNGKLANCESRDPKKCEIFIVEGDSAGGSAKTARDRNYQAILPIRGKILNVEKASIDKVLANAEIKTMINAFGCGFSEGYGNDFDISKLRYDKIIIMADADVDGAHISTLLLTLFYRFMPELIYEGHVYIAMPPLYKAMPKKGEEEYLYDDKALEKYRKNHTGPFTLQRYKGLGEMDAEQLWETTLDPERRLLKLVEIEDARMASSVTEMLMGTEVPPRKAFIYENATEAELDI